MASIEYVVNATGNLSTFLEKAGLTAGHLDNQLEDLSKRIATPEVDLKDTKFTLGMVNAAKRLDKLSAMVADPEVEVDTEKAQLEILRLNAMLDRLDAKHVTATVKVDVDRRGLGGKLGALGGVASGGLAGLGAAVPGVGGLLSNPYSAAAAAAAALASLPFAATAAAGGIVAALGGGFAALGVIAASKTKYIQQQFAALKKSASIDLAGISGPFTQALTQILSAAQETLPKIFGPLKDAFKEIGPAFGAFGQTFVRSFGSPAVAKSIRDIGDAFSALLKALGPSIPSIINAIARGIDGIAQAIKAHPQIFADMINFLGHLVGWSLQAIGALTRVANWLVNFTRDVGHWLNVAWKAFTGFFTTVHNSAVAFQNAVVASFRAFWHNVTAVWNAIWADAKRIVQAGVNAVTGFFRGLWNSISGILGTLRNGIVSAWNTIWTRTRNAVTAGINAVVGFFRGLPGRAVGALSGLGSMLYNFAHQALVKFGNGAKAVWNSVVKWFSGLPATILHALGIHSPPDWAISAGRHVMQGILNGLHLGSGGIAGFIKGLPGKIGNLLTGGSSGATGGDALANQNLARRIFPWGAAQWPAFVQLEMMEAGFNRFARNPSSGAYGIPQALPPTKMPFAAQAAGGSHAGPQLGWMFNYIAGRYGNPVNALSHELSYHWYDQGGALPPGLTLAYNATGQSEQVVGPGSMAQVVALLAQILAAVRIAPAATSAGTARALNSAARGAMR